MLEKEVEKDPPARPRGMEIRVFRVDYP